MKEVTLDVDGMHCATCAQAIEKQLKKLSQVSEAAVNLVTEQAYIKCSDDTPIDDLVSSVKKAGYQAYESEA